MATPKELAYEKRGKLLVKNLQQRHFDAYYCANKDEALAKALELIPEGASVEEKHSDGYCSNLFWYRCSCHHSDFIV